MVELPVDAMGLATVAVRVFARAVAEPNLDHLDLDLPSIEAARGEISLRVEQAMASTFEELVAHCRRPVEIAAYFLALLELVRWGLIEVEQRDWLAPISVRRRLDPTIPEGLT
jgi:chromatin segregation and condensation protein Rec8/ScpA/Scc1 (kleisin family)